MIEKSKIAVKKQKPASAGFCFMGRSCIEKVVTSPCHETYNLIYFGFVFVLFDFVTLL